MNEFITTSDGKISVKRTDFLGHSVSENSISDHITIRTVAHPKGLCVNYSDRNKMLEAAKEIARQLTPIEE